MSQELQCTSDLVEIANSTVETLILASQLNWSNVHQVYYDQGNVSNSSA